MNKRTPQEIGVRLALGAMRMDILFLVLQSAARIGVASVTIGLAVGAVIVRFIRSQLYGTEPFDSGTFIEVPAFMLFAVVTAAYFPALRASRTDPLLS